MNEKENKKLFMALVTGEKLKEVLGVMVSEEEYIMQKDGGEPSTEHLLRLRLLEALRGERVRYSMVHNEEWREHALKKEKSI